MYRDAFKKAVNRTLQKNLDTSEVEYEGVKLLNKDNVAKLSEQFQRFFSDYSVDDLAGKCISMHRDAKPIIEDVLSCSVMLTIGYVTENDQVYFKFSDEDIDYWLSNQEGVLKSGKIKVHVWITLPTMEIIDLSLNVTLMKISGSGASEVNVIFGHADNL